MPRLPDGTHTGNYEEYYAQWGEIIDGLKRIPNVEPRGYNPSISIYYKEKIVSIPVEFAIELNKILDKNEGIK